MERALATAARAAATSISVLLLGESGVGKEVFAERIHGLSLRASKPFLRLNCAALSETLLESELFGHEKGAFTGATQTKPGLLETAHQGTIFLDEIGDMPFALQAKLLRVLEDRMVLRLGGTAYRSIDVRFIAATNRNPEAEVAAQRFRNDLYYRLSGIELVIPPLRERIPEILPLARLFIERGSRELGMQHAPTLSDEAQRALEAYSWPGNIRELRNVVLRALVLSKEPTVVTSADFPSRVRLEVPASNGKTRRAPVPSGSGQGQPTPGVADVVSDEDRVTHASLRSELESIERKRILEALASCGGNQTRAAAVLSMSRRTLVNRLSTYDISRPRRR